MAAWISTRLYLPSFFSWSLAVWGSKVLSDISSIWGLGRAGGHATWDIGGLQIGGNGPMEQTDITATQVA